MAALPVEAIEAVCRYCSPERCQKLFDSGFDINTQNEAGLTLLMLAVEPDQSGDINSPDLILKLVEFLLDNGADPSLVDSDGMRASDYAKQFIDPDWIDEFGYSLRLSKEDIDIMKFVVELLEKR